MPIFRKYFVIVSQDSDSFDGQSFRYVSELWLAWVGKIAGKKEIYDQIKGYKTQKAVKYYSNDNNLDSL